MPPAAETLGRLAAGVGGSLIPPRAGATAVSDVTHDSRRAGPGHLYVAVTGMRFDGHDFVGHAADAGAVAACVEREMATDLPLILVPDTRRALGPLSSAVHGHPSAHLDVVGVTGTNGKTTVTHYVESIALRSGMSPGLIGTIRARARGEEVASTRTTPEAPDLQRLLRRMREGGIDVVAMEVSSHALDMRRVQGTEFAVAAFTNLSQDHLDYHGDMGSYLEAKRRLFTEHEVLTAVFNIDDPAGRRLADDHDGPLLTVGQGGDVTATPLSDFSTSGVTVVLETPSGGVEARIPVRSPFNLENAALAAACCLGLGIGPEAIAAGLSQLDQVPGRFEVVPSPDPFVVVVDYAHTPEGISQAVRAARGLTGSGRVIAVLGAGGDRDRDKRPKMGEAVSGADVVLVTSDNPRSEDPASIARAVQDGIVPGTDVRTELDRGSAIAGAISMAGEGDVVLVLGKGHEQTQEIGSEKIPFSDSEVAAAEMERLRSLDSAPSSGNMTP